MPLYQKLGGSCDPVGSPTARSSRGAILNGMVLCGNQNLGANKLGTGMHYSLDIQSVYQYMYSICTGIYNHVAIIVYIEGYKLGACTQLTHPGIDNHPSRR